VDTPRRRKVAKELRKVAETVAGCQTVGTPPTRPGQ
jgi:hypothetical protein